jgi:NhaP-type Na+/H+ or K+/H+ antiporter
MRGVVSLGAALYIPVLAVNEQPLPYRNLILFITFVVILITLVLQGLSLPWLIRKLKLENENGPAKLEHQPGLRTKTKGNSFELPFCI